MQLVPATPADELWLRTLLGETFEEQFIAIPPAQRASLIAMQVEAKTRDYLASWPAAVNQIVWLRGQRVGRVLTDESPERVHLVDMAIARELRGQGLGSAVLKGFQSQASARGKCIHLEVLKTNPARQLYARLGFRLESENVLSQVMVWNPAIF